MDGLTSAGKERGVDFSGFFTKGSAIATTELFLKFRDTSEQFFDEVMAASDIFRQRSRRVEVSFRRLFGHDVLPRFETTLFYNRGTVCGISNWGKQTLISRSLVVY